MADAKISALTALAGTDLVATDLLPVIDVSATTAGSKNMTIDEFLTGILGGTSVLDTTYALAAGAQFQIYNVSGANYERGVLKFASNILTLGYESGGSGTANRTLRLSTYDTIQFYNTQYGYTMMTVAGAAIAFGVSISLSGGINLLNHNGYHEFKEISDPTAASADGGRLYVKDNGAGKTQLCIRFNTGAVQVIATEP